MLNAKQHTEFLTVTCLEWKHVLAEDRFKDIITDSPSPLLVFFTNKRDASCYSVREHFANFTPC
jgi:hypothetical protein